MNEREDDDEREPNEDTGIGDLDGLMSRRGAPAFDLSSLP
jgi:hypothetical protein